MAQCSNLPQSSDLEENVGLVLHIIPHLYWARISVSTSVTWVLDSENRRHLEQAFSVCLVGKRRRMLSTLCFS